MVGIYRNRAGDKLTWISVTVVGLDIYREDDKLTQVGVSNRGSGYTVTGLANSLLVHSRPTIALAVRRSLPCAALCLTSDRVPESTGCSWK